jgi:hypothetical protein
LWHPGLLPAPARARSRRCPTTKASRARPRLRCLQTSQPSGTSGPPDAAPLPPCCQGLRAEHCPALAAPLRWWASRHPARSSQRAAPRGRLRGHLSLRSQARDHHLPLSLHWHLAEQRAQRSSGALHRPARELAAPPGAQRAGPVEPTSEAGRRAPLARLLMPARRLLPCASGHRDSQEEKKDGERENWE